MEFPEQKGFMFDFAQWICTPHIDVLHWDTWTELKSETLYGQWGIITHAIINYLLVGGDYGPLWGLVGLRLVVVASQVQLVENWGLTFLVWAPWAQSCPALAPALPLSWSKSCCIFKEPMVGTACPTPKALKLKEKHLKKSFILLKLGWSWFC